MNLKWAVFFYCLFVVVINGCSKMPCYPPDHYAPEPNAPYTAEEVRIPTPKGHKLAGTLTLPTMVKAPYPAVLVITGSSPQERDHMIDFSPDDKSPQSNGSVLLPPPSQPAHIA